MMPGAEYLNAAVLLALWAEIGTAFAASLAAAGTDLQTFLKELNPAWNLVGRVHFNLAENRRDPELPFAFMATYIPRLGKNARAQHLRSIRRSVNMPEPITAPRSCVCWNRFTMPAITATGFGSYWRAVTSIIRSPGRRKKPIRF